MRLAFAIVLAGCWRTPLEAPPQNIAPPEVRPPFPRHSVWTGTYRCNQGLSAVRLTIDAKASGEAVARYEFGPVESNPDVPSGAFELAGTLRATGPSSFDGELEPTRWIERPGEYFMVGLSIATSGSPRRLRGSIHHETCSEFKVRRVS